MSDYILEMKHVRKEFPGVVALDDVSFSVKRGVIHALIGENGAGKSTLMKVLNGVYPATSGEIFLNGQQLDISGVKQAQAAGICQRPLQNPDHPPAGGFSGILQSGVSR